MSYVKLFSVLLLCVALTESIRWTNSWAVGVNKDMTEIDVNKLAEKYGFQNNHQVPIP